MSDHALPAEPATIRAGDTVAWVKALPDYPASQWTLSYRLINGASRYDITAAPEGDAYRISLAAAVTATYAPGGYTWISWVSKGAERYSIDAGSIEVLPDIAAVSAPGLDLRTPARKVLDLIDAAMLEHGSRAWTQEYSIAGRQMRFVSMSDFMSYRSKLQQEVTAEEMAAGGRRRNRLRVRF